MKTKLNNSYSVKEDEVLWELHEIRHELHGELKKHHWRKLIGGRGRYLKIGSKLKDNMKK